ncbi:MAG: response regulator [Chlamydiota bacterium]
MRAKQAVTLLLVEDNPGDVRLLMEIVKEERIAASLRVAGDGAAALASLRAAGAALPDLILLDLNLPRKNGLEFLAEMKADVALKRIPVIVLTGSEAEEDIERAYELHANCYIVKPSTIKGLVAVVRGIAEFWLGIARLPGRGGMAGEGG